MHITPDLFLDSIILLLHDNGQRHQKVVKELIDLHEGDNKDRNAPDELTVFYIKIIYGLISETIDRSNRDALRVELLRFKSDPAIASRREVYDLLHDIFMSRDEMSVDRLAGIAERLQNVILWHRQSKMMRQMFAKHNRIAEIPDPQAQRAEMAAIARAANDLTASITVMTRGDEDAIDQINFHDLNSISRGLAKVRARNVEGVLKTGLQGLNRMFGARGGPVRGESITFNALPHQYKSGLLNSCAMWTALYNPVPPVDADGLKPLVYMASVENEAFQNMFWIFKQQYALRTGKSPSGMTDEEIGKWLHDLFAEQGYALIIERHQPQDFGYEEFAAKLAHFRAMGYSVHAAIVDYMNEMRMGSLDKNASSAGKSYQVRELFSRMCNHTKSLGVTLFTAHPLNRKAQEVAATYKNPVTKFTAEHLADSIDVERQVDVSIYVYLAYNDEMQRFLTMQMRKHRYVDDTPEAHKYCAYPFTPLGILDDINDAPRYVKDIYAYGAEQAMNDNEQALSLAASVF